MLPPADYVPAANPQTFEQYNAYVQSALSGLASTNQDWTPNGLVKIAQRAHLLAEAAINELVRRNQRDYAIYQKNMY
jgi:Pyruvate/2-oxoacid:ferredoxin oxidoreductase gamma subunit